jgi:hypothetical protein
MSSKYHEKNEHGIHLDLLKSSRTIRLFYFLGEVGAELKLSILDPLTFD